MILPAAIGWSGLQALRSGGPSAEVAVAAVVVARALLFLIAILSSAWSRPD